MARMLIVEDNEVNQKLLSAILRKCGHEADVAENGQVALEKMDTTEYALIWMDLMMPVMDGYETIRRIRDDEKLRDSKIITVTADTMIGARENAYELGTDDFLTKPYTKQHILDLIERHLGEEAEA